MCASLCVRVAVCARARVCASVWPLCTVIYDTAFMTGMGQCSSHGPVCTGPALRSWTCMYRSSAPVMDLYVSIGPVI